MPALDDATLTALIPPLRRFARSLVNTPDTADDLVQAALERALSTRTDLRDPEAIQPWLFSILYRQFIDHTRRERRRQRLLTLLSLQPPAHAPSPEHITEHNATLAALSRLAPEQRALLLLVSVEGFSYQQAADTLRVPIGTIMSRLSRARERLRALSEEGIKPLSHRERGRRRAACEALPRGLTERPACFAGPDWGEGASAANKQHASANTTSTSARTLK